MQIKSEPIQPSKEKPFIHYDLNIDPPHKNLLTHFEISKSSEIKGILEEFEQSFEEIKLFIASLGENNLEACTAITSLILRLSQEALSLLQQESAHIIIRASIANEEYKIPFWHQDGYYFRPYQGTPLKAVITLKGPGTLFYSPSELDLERIKLIKKDRLQLAKILTDESKIESTPKGHGSLFIVGSEAGAIHSMPYINSQRLFISVLPGTKKEIEIYDAQQKLGLRMYQEGKPPQEIVAAIQALSLI